MTLGTIPTVVGLLTGLSSLSIGTNSLNGICKWYKMNKLF